MALGYLLEPFIQINTIVGTPVVGAKIYVYKGNTTVLATTYNDFEGHLNTNPVRTNTLGNCTIIADDSISYDIEILDALGLLLMSKKNITIGNAANGSGELVVESGYGIEVTRTQGSWKVAVDTDLIATQDDLAEKQDKLQAGANIEITNDNTINVVNRREVITEWPIKLERGNNRVKFYLDDDYANQFKITQTPVEFGGANGQYISYITQNDNGEIEATVSEFDSLTFDNIHEGDNITITRDGNDLTISSKDWSSDITDAVSAKLDASTFNTYVNDHADDDITPYTAGTGISVSDHQISCTGDITPYTAGTGISVSDHVISISSSQSKHSDRLTDAGTDTVSYSIAGGDNFAIGIEYDKTNSKANIKIYNYTDSRKIYVSLSHSSNLTTVVPQNNGTTIVTTTSDYNLYDLDIMCMGVGGELPVCSFTIAISVNSAYCEYTVYDKMIYSF